MTEDWLSGLEEEVTKRWDVAFGIAYGTVTCYRCGERFQQGELFKVLFYTSYPVPNQPQRKVRLVHVEDCKLLDQHKSGAVF